MTRSSVVAWKMPTFFNVWRLTVVHSYSKKMLESGDNQIKKKSTVKTPPSARDFTPFAAADAASIDRTRQWHQPHWLWGRAE
jgi:hypothetical protein